MNRCPVVKITDEFYDERIGCIYAEYDTLLMIADGCMRAKVIESESEVPLAIADAFREGNLGVLDYYNLRNVQSDTSMRESIANESKRQPTPEGDE